MNIEFHYGSSNYNIKITPRVNNNNYLLITWRAAPIRSDGEVYRDWVVNLTITSPFFIDLPQRLGYRLRPRSGLYQVIHFQHMPQIDRSHSDCGRPVEVISSTIFVGFRDS